VKELKISTLNKLVSSITKLVIEIGLPLKRYLMNNPKKPPITATGSKDAFNHLTFLLNTLANNKIAIIIENWII
jgi:hypothetical protein